jgi:thymidylate synthase (FAD)
MKLPIFVARQMIRHRTASVNEYSGRYSEMSEDMFVPELDTIKPQSTTNKQGRSGDFSDEVKEVIQLSINNENDRDQEQYKLLLETGLAKETARGVLSVNNYTEWFYTIDLHNLFHFLKLRMDAHAQYEIRIFADAMYKLIQPIVPIACEAFADYIFDVEKGSYQNYKLSRQELVCLRALIDLLKNTVDITSEIDELVTQGRLSQRELSEFRQKFDI